MEQSDETRSAPSARLLSPFRVSTRDLTNPSLVATMDWDDPTQPTPLADIQAAQAQMPKGETMDEWAARLNKKLGFE